MPAINGTATHRLARVIALRQEQFAARILVASVVAGIFFGFTGWIFATVWFGAFVGLQLVERALFANVDVEALLTSPSRYRQTLVILGANITLFGSFGVAEVIEGGPWGLACACLLWGGAMINSVVTANGSKHAFFAQALPSTCFYLTAPGLAIIVGAPWIDACAVMIAGGLNVVAGITVFGASQRLYEAEQTARAELERKKLEAEAATHAKSAFVAMVSHELRTPISAILAGAGEIERLSGASAASSHALLITDSARMMRTLLNDLLDLSKIEAGRMSVENAPFDLRALVLDTLRLWSPEVRKKGLRLRLKGAARLPRYALGDAMRIKQILNNLFSNACKFTPHGSVALAISTRAKDGGVVDVVFSVVDTGPGLAPEQIARLFQPFEQLGPTTAGAHGGTGLGLAISRDLAELMGGCLTVESAPGAGAAFTLAVPLRPLEAIKANEPPALERTMGPPLSVLIADDHEVNRRAFSLMLSAASVEVSTAENGQQALELLDTAHFDLVLMDVNMPVLSGLDAVRRLRASGSINRQAPVIALTAAAGAKDLALCLEAGMDAVVAKPVDGAELFAAMERLIAPAPEPLAARA
jgi:signal transduction histidine kinase/ActR/RegA family two-component response regulator